MKKLMCNKLTNSFDKFRSKQQPVAAITWTARCWVVFAFTVLWRACMCRYLSLVSVDRSVTTAHAEFRLDSTNSLHTHFLHFAVAQKISEVEIISYQHLLIRKKIRAKVLMNGNDQSDKTSVAGFKEFQISYTCYALQSNSCGRNNGLSIMCLGY